ncbi:hypothetical protein [Deinococcus rufus]|uniref:Uncharacterized protein n=1 Tax=Deinococcus rufus TaxID=2136097 RepID=A0ABV7Z9R5_9DEIO
MGALQLIGLLLRGRAALVPTDPRECAAQFGEERFSIDVTFQRDSGEFRVITNMGRAVALDVHDDLARCATLEGSHLYATQLGAALGVPRTGKPS